MAQGTPTNANGPLETESILDRFEEAWKEGHAPDLAYFLPPVDEVSSATSHRELLCELVMIDLWHRWRQASMSQFLSEGPRVEDYVRSYPEMGPIEELPLDLIAEEYRARLRFGDRPEQDAYRERFPHAGPHLAEVLLKIREELMPDTRASGVTFPWPPPGTSDVALAPPGPVVALEKIGKYHIIGMLDEGGQAEVYRAVNPDLSREVVLKLGRPLLGPSQAAARDRLREESRLLAELDHPAIAKVLDLDFFECRPYLVMEYIRGRNLRQYAEQHPVPPRESAGLVAMIARAIGTAHARGIVHQDIKPKNLLIDEAGQPRVIDFGLARLCNAWRDNTAEPGTVIGTIEYMAPEQARGETDRVGPAADIFALGGVLYFLLTGQAPFAGAGVADSLERAREGRWDDAALSSFGIPRALAAICRRAMELDPADRYATAEEMADALERYLRQPSQLKWLLAVLGATAIVVAAMLGIFKMSGRQDTPPGPVQPRTSRESETALGILKRPLRHDFPVQFTLLGQKENGSHQVTFVEGQRIAFQISSSRDCYVGIWHIDSKGTVTQLFPTARDKDHFLPAGASRTIPGDMEYAIRATMPEGAEYLHFVASSERWEPKTGENLGAHVVFATLEERRQWEDQIRGIVIEQDRSPKVSEVFVPFEVRRP